MTLRVLEAFAGVGSQRMALRNLGVDFEVVAISEIDKYAIESYEAIHGETNNLGDISKVKVEDIPDHDLFTYSFPCQDISVAGEGKGFDEESGTRSSLLWECRKVIKGKKPKYLLLENVKNLVSKKFKPDFLKWLDWLKEQGYTNYWDVLNAKDYGIPQNRERVFVVSILGKHEPYSFPATIDLELRLKDLLEDEVSEKFYLSDEQMSKLTFKSEALGTDIKQIGQLDAPTRTNSSRYRTYDPKGISPTITTMGGGNLEPHIKIIGNTSKTNYGSENVHDTNGISSTLTARDYKGPKQIMVKNPYLKIKNATKKGYIEATEGDGVDLAYPSSEMRRGRVQKDMVQTLTTSDDKGVVLKPYPTGTLYAHNSKKFGNGYMKDFSKTLKAEKHDTCVVFSNFKIRKLTPLEYWRLMGFTDRDFYKAEAVCSNSQLYKQAGNSIVVDVLEGIFGSLLDIDMKFKKKPIEIQLELF